MGKPARQNLIGLVVRKIRYQRGLTQAMLTARCNRSGWDIGENTIAKIEARICCVTDKEIPLLANALGVKVRICFNDRNVHGLGTTLCGCGGTSFGDFTGGSSDGLIRRTPPATATSPLSFTLKRGRELK